MWCDKEQKKQNNVSASTIWNEDFSSLIENSYEDNEIIKGGYVMYYGNPLAAIIFSSVISVTNQGFKGLQETITKISVVLSEQKWLSMLQ